MRSKVSVLWAISASLIILAVNVFSQDGSRTLELSAQNVPLFGSASFFDSNGTPVGSPVAIDGERFFWTTIPNSASQAILKTVTEKAVSIDLNPTDNTLVTVNSIASGEVGSANNIVERLSSVSRVPSGAEGWVFIGSLVDPSQLSSEWRSLYIVENVSRERPDKRARFTFDSLRKKISDSPTPPAYRTDFPLYLRSSPGGANQSSDKVVRAGQIIQLKEIKNIDGRVYARVIVES